ncbi:hypothetical protein [Cytobacillus gottheilii]|uniref:hypothetical protein n=1 Tax=Cytobacillus gottheilii TaxID=859144 RepID=UPI002148E4A2|nr:hypothetical protein [Cytobacillus gottheilii]
MEKLVNKIQSDIEELKNRVGEKNAAKLELDKCMRIIKRLEEFSANCEECHQYVNDLESHFIKLLNQTKTEELTQQDIKLHRKITANITSHLINKHKLVTSGYYMSVYLSLGLSLGMVFGLLLFDNMPLGLPIGMGIGVAIGSGLDTDAKKKGKVL